MKENTAAPWDQLKYFFPPSVVLVQGTQLAGSDTVVAPADSARVVLIFTDIALQNNLCIAPIVSTQVSGGGIILTTQVPNYEFSWGIHGALVQLEWHAFLKTSDILSVMSISLKEWPTPRSKRAKAIAPGSALYRLIHD